MASQAGHCHGHRGQEMRSHLRAHHWPCVTGVGKEIRQGQLCHLTELTRTGSDLPTEPLDGVHVSASNRNSGHPSRH